jgi:hypothetical protein
MEAAIMNWYKLAQLHGDKGERLRGEWWFIDGQAYFADMDVNDVGHEGVAQEWAASMISDALAELIRKNENQIKAAGGDVGSILRYLNDEPDAAEVMRKVSYIDDDLHERIQAELVAQFGEETVGVAMREGDGRLWGLKRGWIRCKGNWLEMMNINSTSLKNAAEGIGGAYGEEVNDNTPFNIEQTSNRRSFSNVPLYVIEKGNPGLLLQYRDMI